MELVEIRKHYSRRPFQPIEIEFRDGKRVPLHDWIHMGFSYDGKKLSVWDIDDTPLRYLVDEVVAIHPCTEQPAASSK